MICEYQSHLIDAVVWRLILYPHSLSFYKESLAGETDNYVHLRAAAERKTPTEVLRELSDEITETVHKITTVVASDSELADIWQKFLHVRATLPSHRFLTDLTMCFLQGYLEFHVKTPRYRLAELNFHM